MNPISLFSQAYASAEHTVNNKNGQEGDVKLYRRASPIAPEREEAYWQHLYELIKWRPTGPAHVFVFDIESAAYVTFSGDGTMRRLTWPGGQWRTKKSS